MAKKRSPVPHISAVGFSNGTDDEMTQYYRSLREAISAASRLIRDIEGPSGRSNVFQVAITGTLRRLERIVDPNNIEFIAIPRPSPPSSIDKEPEFDDTPNVSLEGNKLVTALSQLREKKRGHWVQVDQVSYEHYPTRAIVKFRQKFGNSIGTLIIYMVPGKKHWGINRIATSGDEEFNQWATTSKTNGGMLPAGTEYANQMLIDTTKRKPKELNLRTEKAVFDYCGLSYIPVIFRQDKLWLTYMETKQNILPKAKQLDIHVRLEKIEEDLR
jgi:DNA polymerase/3'-5' exonuclease PolX